MTNSPRSRRRPRPWRNEGHRRQHRRLRSKVTRSCLTSAAVLSCLLLQLFVSNVGHVEAARTTYLPRRSSSMEQTNGHRKKSFSRHRPSRRMDDAGDVEETSNTLHNIFDHRATEPTCKIRRCKRFCDNPKKPCAEARNPDECESRRVFRQRLCETKDCPCDRLTSCAEFCDDRPQRYCREKGWAVDHCDKVRNRCGCGRAPPAPPPTPQPNIVPIPTTPEPNPIPTPKPTFDPECTADCRRHCRTPYQEQPSVEVVDRCKRQCDCEAPSCGDLCNNTVAVCENGFPNGWGPIKCEAEQVWCECEIETLPPVPAPSSSPTVSAQPSQSPSVAPSHLPSVLPSNMPSQSSDGSSNIPTDIPSSMPSQSPSSIPSSSPSITAAPSPSATRAPGQEPTVAPSALPSNGPSVVPSTVPSQIPSSAPSSAPTLSLAPTVSSRPSSSPTVSAQPTTTTQPSALPSQSPSVAPSHLPSALTSNMPSQSSDGPSSIPSNIPSVRPSLRPSSMPSTSAAPTIRSVLFCS